MEWEPVKLSGDGPGSISHHTCVGIDDDMLLIGGQQGEEDNPHVYKLCLRKHSWSKVKQEGDVPEPRDDHSLVQLDDYKFLIFGGFVSGSRTNQIYQFEYTQNSIVWQELFNDDAAKNAPAPRSSHSACHYNGSLYVYGGEDMEHVKLDDLWAFDLASKTWR